MLYAMVEGVRTQPSTELKGTCPACGSTVIAKCGTLRVHHWAHKAVRSCDGWWERETPWHSAWKMMFPLPYQEYIQCDDLGERHIADVRMPHGLVIEFQHSHLRQQERVAREKFYKNLWWVVDGSRLSRDLSRFASAIASFRSLWQGVYVTPFPEEAFAPSWLTSDVPVFFDFENATEVRQDKLFVTRSLWCLLPRRPFGQTLVLRLTKNDLLRWAHDKSYTALSEAYLAKAEEILSLERQLQMRRWRAAQMRGHGQQRRIYRRRLAKF